MSSPCPWLQGLLLPSMTQADPESWGEEGVCIWPCGCQAGTGTQAPKGHHVSPVLTDEGDKARTKDMLAVSWTGTLKTQFLPDRINSPLFLRGSLLSMGPHSRPKNYLEQNRHQDLFKCPCSGLIAGNCFKVLVLQSLKW